MCHSYCLSLKAVVRSIFSNFWVDISLKPISFWKMLSTTETWHKLIYHWSTTFSNHIQKVNKSESQCMFSWKLYIWFAFPNPMTNLLMFLAYEFLYFSQILLHAANSCWTLDLKISINILPFMNVNFIRHWRMLSHLCLIRVLWFPLNRNASLFS